MINLKLLLGLMLIGIMIVGGCIELPPPDPDCEVDTDCEYGTMCHEGECIVCPVPPCGANPGPNCRYEGGGPDERGCNYQCGTLECDPQCLSYKDCGANQDCKEGNCVDKITTVNEPPTAVILTPSEGSSYEVGDTVSYSGTVSDSDSSPVKISWFVDRMDDGLSRALLKELSQSPSTTSGTVKMEGTMVNRYGKTISLEDKGETYNMVLMVEDGENDPVEIRRAFTLKEDKPEPVETKPRLLVTTDIGGDPDDQQSMIRLLVYSNEYDIEGLIASASGTLNELDESVTNPQYIRERVEAYGDVRSNLIKHEENYPTESELLSVIKSGNKYRQWDYVGSGHDTEGSNHILAMIKKDDPRPLNIAIWGGQTDVAQALWKLKSQGSSTYNKYLQKVRIYDIDDQDEIYDKIVAEHPDLFYILSENPNGVKDMVYPGIYYGGDYSTTSQEWVREHISRNHGPLSPLYPDEGLWTPREGRNAAFKEGDTPAYLFFLKNGLSDSTHPNWGSWGGRFEAKTGNLFRDAKDTVEGTHDYRSTVWRFRPEFQNDFAARMDWNIKSYSDANHNPVAVLNGDKTKNIVYITKQADEQVTLSAAGSSDPDGDSLSYKWWVYEEAGSYDDTIQLSKTTGSSTSFDAPREAKPVTVHVILEVTDNGSPKLTSYRRAVVTIND